jgi:hypothetical protein
MSAGQMALPFAVAEGETVRYIDNGAIWGNREIHGTVLRVYSVDADAALRALVRWATGHELPTFAAALERVQP